MISLQSDKILIIVRFEQYAIVNYHELEYTDTGIILHDGIGKWRMRVAEREYSEGEKYLNTRNSTKFTTSVIL